MTRPGADSGASPAGGVLAGLDRDGIQGLGRQSFGGVTFPIQYARLLRLFFNLQIGYITTTAGPDLHVLRPHDLGGHARTIRCADVELLLQ